MFSLLLGVLMAILDTTVVNIAIPKMMSVFNAPTDKIEWVLTGYMLTIGVLVPITGFLQDTFGSKRLYLFALTVFTAGSALCGLAWSADAMIVFRVMQAVGGGMMMPLTMSMFYRLMPPEERGLAMGFWGISIMFAPAFGPTLGGYIVEYLDWRLIFTLNIPLGLIGWILAYLLIPEMETKKGQRFDLAGFIFSSIGFFTLLYALNEGTAKGWTSLYILALLFTAASSLVIFVVLELYQEEPMLDLRLFKNATFTLAVLIGSIDSIAMFSGVFLVPLFLQTVMNLSPMQTGMLLFPAALATGIVMPISGRLFDRIGARPLVVAGMAMATFTTLHFHRLNVWTPLSTVMLWYMYRGIGMGMTMMPATTAGLNTVDLAKVSRATALTNAVRQVASSFGIAIFTTILQRRIIFHAADYAAGLNAHSPVTQAAMSRIGLLAAQAGLPSAGKALTAVMIGGAVQRQAFVAAIDDVFWIAAFFTVSGALLGLFLKTPKASNGRRPAAAMEV